MRRNDSKPLPSERPPRFIRVSVDQIRVPLSTFMWAENANFYPMSIPSVKESALGLIQFLQPILVRKSDEVTGESNQTKPVYTLVGGRRTFQLIAEQKRRQTEISVLLLQDELLDTKSMEVMDILCSILLNRPDDQTKALLAYGLRKDVDFSQVASKLIVSSKIEDVANLLCMDKSSVHRILSDPFCKDLEDQADARLNTAISLGDALDDI